MYAFKNILVVLVIASAFAARADVLMSWGDGEQGTEWDWYPDENQLTILRGDGNDYKFWFHDGSEVSGTGVIDNITVDPNAVVDFTLILMTPAGDPGALEHRRPALRRRHVDRDGRQDCRGLQRIRQSDSHRPNGWLVGSRRQGRECHDR